MNGVDKPDRNGHDNSVTIRKNRWYLQIWFWEIEQVIHYVYIVVCYVANVVPKDDWNKYTSKHYKRKILQLDLGIGFIEYVIRLDWVDENDKENKQYWMT